MHPDDQSEAEQVHPLEHAANGLRRLTSLLLRVYEDDRALLAVAEELEEIRDRLEKDAGTAHDSVRDGSSSDPVSGRVNALAPPLTMKVGDDGFVAASGALGLEYQGPRGMVHGGVSALLLAHVLVVAAGDEGVSAETLSIRYGQRVPLFEELVVTGGEVERAVGRVAVRGAITVAGSVAVSAEGRFVARADPDLSSQQMSPGGRDGRSRESPRHRPR